MKSRSPHERALRALVAGRVAVLYAHGEHVSATVDNGAGQTWAVSHDRNGWACACPQPATTCAHVIAVRLIARQDIRE